MDYLVKMELLAQWVQEVSLVKEEEQDFQELLVVVVTMVLLEQLANLDHQALLDLQDFPVLQVLRGKMVLLVPQAPVGHLVQEGNLVLKALLVVLVLLGLVEEMEAQEQKVHQVLLVFLALLD